MDDVSDRMNPRLRFVGYTDNDRLERRTALVYGDDIGLSVARARRAMETVKAELTLVGRTGRARRPRLRALERRRERRLHPGRHRARRRRGRLRRAGTARRLRGRRDHPDHARTDAAGSARPQPHAHHRRRRSDRRPGPKLRGHPALHGRRARSSGYRVSFRRPRFAAAPERDFGAGLATDARGSERLHGCIAGELQDVQQLPPLHRARGSPDLRFRAIAARAAPRHRRPRARRPRRMAARQRRFLHGAAARTEIRAARLRRRGSLRRNTVPQSLWMISEAIGARESRRAAAKRCAARRVWRERVERPEHSARKRRDRQGRG